MVDLFYTGKCPSENTRPKSSFWCIFGGVYGKACYFSILLLFVKHRDLHTSSQMMFFPTKCDILNDNSCCIIKVSVRSSKRQIDR